MARSKFINNKAEISGGGVYFKSVEQMTINDTEFSKTKHHHLLHLMMAGGVSSLNPLNSSRSLDHNFKKIPRKIMAEASSL